MSRRLGAIILIMVIIVGLLSGCSKSAKSNAVEEKEDYGTDTVIVLSNEELCG